MQLLIEVEFDANNHSIRDRLCVLEHCIKEGLYGDLKTCKISSEVKSPHILGYHPVSEPA